MLKKTRTGFTLVESLVVLAISSLIVGMLLLCLNVFPQNSMKEKAFWRLFNEKWNESIQRGKNEGRVTDVRIWKGQDVEFRFYKNKHLISEYVDIPEGLSANGQHDIFITPTGFTKPQTINWYSKNRHCGIQQKFQLGWGIYYCEDDK
ncbi:prepilin-type N-terminal cleavage/methylation domain-containing protein [Fructilactobacillus sp. Tb1]|uniref:prepilin-type N-terminal cleavage/methylation domain-containing protein n=1 Tax=Fructilactobacillus sp. Tb1 TaxID=3422304 RepID=UPI003D2E3FF1